MESRSASVFARSRRAKDLRFIHYAKVLDHLYQSLVASSPSIMVRISLPGQGSLAFLVIFVRDSLSSGFAELGMGEYRLDAPAVVS